MAVRLISDQRKRSQNRALEQSSSVANTSGGLQSTCFWPIFSNTDRLSWQRLTIVTVEKASLNSAGSPPMRVLRKTLNHFRSTGQPWACPGHPRPIGAAGKKDVDGPGQAGPA